MIDIQIQKCDLIEVIESIINEKSKLTIKMHVNI